MLTTIPANLAEGFFDPGQYSLLILDDVMDDAYKHSGVQRLFIGGSHHDGVSVILTAQDVFPDGRHSLVCRKNMSHLAVFHLGFKQDQMRTLSQQTFPNTPTKLSDIYERLLGLDVYNKVVIDACVISCGPPITIYKN